MKLGLFMMPLHPPGRPHAEAYDEDLRAIELADRLGLSEAWIGEHFLLPWENMPAPDLFISRALGVTERIAFGTGVVLLHFHNPILVAHRIAMLDHLAKGRLYFGIGSGGSPSDLQMFGIDAEAGSPGERMKEGIDLILQLWEKGPFEFHGKFFHVGEPGPAPKVGFHMTPYQQPHPPIAVAGSSARSRTLSLAGERGWWPMSGSLVHSSHLSVNWGSVLDGAAKTGRKPSRRDWRIGREVYVAETSRKAREDVLNGAIARDFVQYWLKFVGGGARGLGAFKYDPDIPDDALTPEYMLDNYWIVGDPDECAEKIGKLHTDSGGFGTLLVQTNDWGRDTKKWYRSMELLATEVMPAVEHLES